jgi:LysM repeat protein
VAPRRLTRRGVVVLGAVVVALCAALWVAASSASAGAHAGSAPRVHAVTVSDGDTLWSIAGRVAPDRDPRAEVAALQRSNHLSGVDLTPGQRLAIP